MVSATNQNDQELNFLVKEAASGDERAFGQIYDLYFAKVYRFIYYRVNHSETAEDLASETFIRVWNKLAQIGDAAAFQAWLFRIARNLVVDHYRARKITVDITELENFLEYEDNIIDQANLGFDQKKFLEALKKLSPDQQVVIKLKFLDELENDEIAKILEKSEGAIRVIQHRAIAELKHRLNNNQ